MRTVDVVKEEDLYLPHFVMAHSSKSVSVLDCYHEYRRL
jgi:hypothetical protein